MTRVAIISTSIYGMPNIVAWSSLMGPDDVMIIAGDLKSPHDATRNVVNRERERTGRDIRYVHPEDQGVWRSSDALPWNCIQRRNIAALEALTTRPDVILTIDDDNYPAAVDDDTRPLSWLDTVHWRLTTKVDDLVHAHDGWFNPGEWCYPEVVHRGFPFELRHERHYYREVATLNPVPVGVFAALWTGDPDVDAVERIAKRPNVREVSRPNVTLDLETWAPFNSQSTAYRAELAPLMMCIPHIGRMDDIWASYVARTVMDHIGWHVQYGHPLVHQDRNEHNLVRDLEGELLGYRHTLELCTALRDMSLPDTTNVIALLDEVVTQLYGLPYVPAAAITVYDAWLQDLRRIDHEHADARLFDVARTEYHGEQL